MERLEAALEKAREQRRSTGRESRGPATPKPINAPVQENWNNLKEIKLSQRVARNNRVTTLQTGPGSGAYDMLRSRTLRIMRENGWRTLAVTSPNKECGKTTVSTNLAISLARQSDLKILLLDMDMRRPSLHKILAHRPAQSLHAVFEGKADPREQFVRIGENLALGMNNSAAHNPSELLQSKGTKSCLADIERLFQPDITIFDMPPMLVSDDNVGFLENADCGLLVGAAEETTITQLDSCEKELAELTNVLGIVLNKCRYIDNDSGYDYDYY